MRTLAVLGASGHGKVVADIAEQVGWQSIVFFDDAWTTKTKIKNWDVIGNTDNLLNSLDVYKGIFVAIGDNSIRGQKLDLLKEAGAKVSTLIHPSAVVSDYASLGQGTVLMPGVVVNVDAKVGEGVILNTGCTIDHDCKIGNAVHISPGVHLSGNVSVGIMSWLGVGVSVCQGVAIGERVMVGAGAAVINDLPAGVKAVGIPARF
jgi:sugar O-acyltransferase (sialic acid O-acetyltransferase NeuD family)